MAETRITAGEWRGRLIATPRGAGVRPTRSMVRQSLFNILGERVVEARVLDLFAGAGTLGFEALSRGAAHTTFVDRDTDALRCITATAARFSCGERCAVVRDDVKRWLRHQDGALQSFDLCFVDAPYRDPELDDVLAVLGAFPPNLVVCEHHQRRRLSERAGQLVRVREVRHGLTTLTILQNEPEATSQAE